MEIAELENSTLAAWLEKPLAVVDFYAEWCGPCRSMSAELEKFAAEHPEVAVGKVNIDENPALAAEYGVSTIPAIFLYREGAPVKRFTGFTGRRTLAAALGL